MALLGAGRLRRAARRRDRRRAPTPPAPAYVRRPIPVPPPRPPPADRAPRALAAQVERWCAASPARPAIAVRAVDEGWTVEAGGAPALPQQSVSKLWVAMTVLDQRDQGRLRLDDPVTRHAATT